MKDLSNPILVSVDGLYPLSVKLLPKPMICEAVAKALDSWSLNYLLTWDYCNGIKFSETWPLDTDS